MQPSSDDHRPASTRDRALASAALVVAGVGWGIGFPLAKVALREIDAGSMILLRYAIAALLVLPVILSRSGLAIFANRAVIVAGVSYGVAYFVQFEGVARTTVSLAAMLIGVSPVLVALTARLVFHEPITVVRWSGIVLAAVGTAMVARGPVSDAAHGIVLILASLLLCLGWIFALRRLSADTDALAASCAVVVVGALVIIPIVLARNGLPPVHLAAATWAGILGQSVFATAVALVAWQFGAARLPAASAGVFLNIEPLVGALAGVVFFRETPTAAMLLGGTAIIAGGLLVTRGGGTVPTPARR